MQHSADVLTLNKKLLSCPSITPDDAGCQKIIADYLTTIGFNITHLPFGDVSNLWAKHGHGNPVFVFVGHTDVVPPGNIQSWQSSPFEPTIRDENLYARGAADMKSSIAAMMIAAKRFVTEKPNYKGSIAFLITSDEEGVAINGTQKVVEYLQTQNQQIDWCLVGEASCEKIFGDTVKIGRRGSLNGEIIIYGKQGHIAYPEKAKNPIHIALSALTELTNTHWDNGNNMFPPTQFQISNIHAGVGATNVIPEQIQITFNFRYSPESTIELLQNKTSAVLQKHHLTFKINWQKSSLPFYTKNIQLINSLSESIQQVTGITPQLSTTGGTSDGRFIAPLGSEVVEFGPINESIHQVNEHISVKSLEQLTEIYYQTLKRLF